MSDRCHTYLNNTNLILPKSANVTQYYVAAAVDETLVLYSDLSRWPMVGIWKYIDVMFTLLFEFA